MGRPHPQARMGKAGSFPSGSPGRWGRQGAAGLQLLAEPGGLISSPRCSPGFCCETCSDPRWLCGPGGERPEPCGLQAPESPRLGGTRPAAAQNAGPGEPARDPRELPAPPGSRRTLPRLAALARRPSSLPVPALPPAAFVLRIPRLPGEENPPPATFPGLFIHSATGLQARGSGSPD